MYGECEGSQDKEIMMVSITKGPQERRRGVKRRDEEKSATQEENCNRLWPGFQHLKHSFSLIQQACSAGVNLVKEMASTSMVFGS